MHSFSPQGLRSLITIGLLFVVGCGAGAGYRLDPQIAEQSLEIALNVWQSGEKQEVLQLKSPKIVMGDYQWAAGKKLVEFKIKSETTLEGSNVRKTVELVLENNGKRSTETVEYLVGTDPFVSIFRP
jgi:hypothetical protein